MDEVCHWGLDLWFQAVLAIYSAPSLSAFYLESKHEPSTVLPPCFCHHYRLLLSETAQLISFFYKLPLTWCFVTAVERQFRHCVCGMCIFMCLYSWMHIWRPEEGTGILLYHCLLYSFKVRSLCEPRACIFSTKWVASRPLLSSSPLASELGLQESMRLG